MIKFNGRKMSAKEAAVQTMLSRLESVGCSTDEQEMLLAMTAKQLDSFFKEYTSVYNKLCSKIGSDNVDSMTLANSAIQRVLIP